MGPALCIPLLPNSGSATGRTRAAYSAWAPAQLRPQAADQMQTFSPRHVPASLPSALPASKPCTFHCLFRRHQLGAGPFRVPGSLPHRRLFHLNRLPVCGGGGGVAAAPQPAALRTHSGEWLGPCFQHGCGAEVVGSWVGGGRRDGRPLILALRSGRCLYPLPHMEEDQDGAALTTSRSLSPATLPCACRHLCGSQLPGGQAAAGAVAGFVAGPQARN